MDEGTTGKRLGNELIDVEKALAHVYPEVRTSYDERDVLLYALGVGAGAAERDLRFVFEKHPEFAALPTYVVAPALSVALANELKGERSPGLNYGFERILHSVQRTELMRPLPRAATLRHQARVKAIYDARKYGVVVTEVRTCDEAGEALAINEFTLTVRGAGGFGGEPGPSGAVNLPPKRAPDAVVEQPTREDQALLYRLSGDRNPLHVDPVFAQEFGLPKPILHGLCTYGFAARHVLRAVAADDASNLKSIRVKFAAPVYPGETLVTELWQESPTRVVFETKAKERDKAVLSNAAVEFFRPLPAAAVPVAAPSVGPATSPGSAAIQALGERLDSALVRQVAAVVQLRVQEPASDWVLDLKIAPGAVRRGIAADADLTLQMADADLAAWLAGASVKDLLSAGRVRMVSGDGRVVQRLAAALASRG
ncbi:MAG: MaoC/PaaZ C-terminal domain-containing protein [Myxococcales bacterium]